MYIIVSILYFLISEKMEIRYAIIGQGFLEVIQVDLCSYLKRGTFIIELNFTFTDVDIVKRVCGHPERKNGKQNRIQE